MKKSTMKHNLLLALSAVLFSTAVHAAPSSPFKNGDGVVAFPNIKDSHFTNPSIIDRDRLNIVDTNMSKMQVARLIGRPHFSEGPFAETVWNYAFRFMQKDGTYLVCQYQVHFDKHTYLTKDMYWSSEECLKFVQNKPEAKPEVVQPQHAISMAADGMFAFGKASLTDLLPAGRAKLERLAEQINQAYNLKSVEIIGHTDRIGSYDRNMALSQARAEAVKAFLANRGVNIALITARGVGSSQPVVTCSGSATAAVIACLQPNRRVEVNLNGTVKN